MIYTDEADLEDTPQTGAEFMAEYAAFTEEMVRRGVIRGGERLGPTWAATTVQVRGGERLGPTWAATTVQVRGGDVMISDSPFAETKKQIGWYYLIECADLDGALKVAAEIPHARQGTIEVWPIWET